MSDVVQIAAGVFVGLILFIITLWFFNKIDNWRIRRAINKYHRSRRH